jgi:hypothetical protein
VYISSTLVANLCISMIITETISFLNFTQGVQTNSQHITSICTALLK